MKLYGSIDNRINENKMFCDKIEVGTGMTRYDWSDCHAFEVVEVTDQQHVKVREYDHKCIGGAYSNQWQLISNENNPVITLTKRGNYWYDTKTITREETEQPGFERIYAVLAGYDVDKAIEKGKSTKYHRWNVSFGVAEYYYDYEF